MIHAAGKKFTAFATSAKPAAAPSFDAGPTAFHIISLVMHGANGLGIFLMCTALIQLTKNSGRNDARSTGPIFSRHFVAAC